MNLLGRSATVRASIAMALALAPVLVSAESGVDDRFDVFLEKFVSDAGFRAGRIADPLPVKIGNVLVEEVRTERWSRAQVRSKLKPLLAADDLKFQGLSRHVKKISGSRVEVSQFRPGGVDYLLTYRFQKIKGAWTLTHFDDASRPQPSAAPPR